MEKPTILGGLKSKTKPFPTWPQWDKSDEKVLLEVLHSGKWSRRDVNNVASHGAKSYINMLEEESKTRFNSKYSLTVSSGTAALDIAVKAIGISSGDEVIVPAYSFIATATCVLHAGGIPVFADIDEDTWNIDVSKLDKHVSPKTKAIIAVHFAGQPADMSDLMSYARKKGLIVIEDAAQAIGAKWQDTNVGSIGDIGCFSLEMTKNLTCGEGGIIVTNNEDFYKKMYSLHLTGRSFSGSWYEHEELGWNYRITEFQAALAYNQMKNLDNQISIREKNAAKLNDLLSSLTGIRLTSLDPRVTTHAYHLFTFRFIPEEWTRFSRKRFILALNAEGIPCYEGYSYPIYKNPLFLSLGYEKYSLICNNAEKITKQSLWLPQNVLLGDEQDIEEIFKAIEKIRYHFNIK